MRRLVTKVELEHTPDTHSARSTYRKRQPVVVCARPVDVLAATDFRAGDT